MHDKFPYVEQNVLKSDRFSFVNYQNGIRIHYLIYKVTILDFWSSQGLLFLNMMKFFKLRYIFMISIGRTSNDRGSFNFKNQDERKM